MMDIDALNSAFAIPGRLGITAGRGGLPMIAIDSDRGSALISLYAGQVLSYRPAGETQDLLFLSDQAQYQPGKAIRGGVPLCWPWFGPDPAGLGRPAHGLARTHDWHLQAADIAPDGAIRIRLGLADDAGTRALWPHAFALTLEISVAEQLCLALVTTNPGDRPLVISQALHSYFKVGDIDRVRVLGLDGCGYADKLSGQDAVQSGALTIDAEVDRVYRDPPAELVIDDPALGRRIHIRAGGSRSAVVWNPWSAVAARMADLADDDYRRMLCVETANAGDDLVSVPAGGAHRLSACYRLTRDR